MPLYDWVDKKTKKAALILRSFGEYKDPPNAEEAAEAGLSEDQAAEAEWERAISRGIQVVRGEGWGGKKGSW